LQKEKPRKGIATRRGYYHRELPHKPTCKKKSPVRGLQPPIHVEVDVAETGSCKKKSPVRGLQPSTSLGSVRAPSRWPCKKKSPVRGLQLEELLEFGNLFVYAPCKKKSPVRGLQRASTGNESRC